MPGNNCKARIVREHATSGVPGMRTECGHSEQGHDAEGCIVCRVAGYEGHEHKYLSARDAAAAV